MTAPLLTVVKARYGRSPWRIVYAQNGQELPHASFDRKRDAVAVRDKLLAAADWGKYPEFTAADKAAVGPCFGIRPAGGCG